MPQIELRVPEAPVCPAAQGFEGATPGAGGVVCRIKELDAARADQILEGSPTGVRLLWREDASSILNFCCGQGEPMADPDEMAARPFGAGHYTGCPIWAAAREWDLVERLYALDPERTRPAAVPGLTVTEDEVEFYAADGGRL
jgi:hypothetical protein